MKLDLTARKEKYLDLTMLDGSTVQIKKPTEAMIVELDKYKLSMVEAKKSEDALNVIRETAAKILNTNTGFKSFDVNFLIENGYEYDICKAIIDAYEKFLAEVMNNPN